MYNCYNELIKVIIMQIFVKRKILSIEIILNLSKQASARTHTHTHTHTHTQRRENEYKPHVLTPVDVLFWTCRS